MLTYSEIAQLSDKDLTDEIANSRNSSFRQKMGVRTNHLKDSHLIRILQKYISQLLTEQTRRTKLGEKVEKTDDKVAKRVKEVHAEIEKKQTEKKKTAEKKEAPAKAEKVEKVEVKEDEKSDVKVKKVEKKGLIKKVFTKKDS